MKNYIKDIFDSRKSPSFSRTSTAVMLYFFILWGTYIVFKTAIIPDIPYGWITIVGILWGVSGAKEAYVKGKEVTNAPPVDKEQ